MLERGSWNVVARAFPRFFNWGETPDCDKAFDWSRAVVQEKHDGSLVLVYKYCGRLFVNTRGSFGTGPIQKGYTLTWHDVFWTAMALSGNFQNPHTFLADKPAARRRMEDALPDGFTAVFELCSPWNLIVRQYATPTAYLLTVYDTATGDELAPEPCDAWAAAMGAARPRLHPLASLAAVQKFLADHPDPTFEGVVACDPSLRRKKVKSGRYEALHRMKCGVEPALSPKTFASFLAHGGVERELVEELGDHAHYFYTAKAAVETLYREMFDLWERNRGVTDQKAFAQAVGHAPTRAFLFEARKRSGDPGAVWTERAESFLANWLVGVVPRGVLPQPTLSEEPV